MGWKWDEISKEALHSDLAYGMRVEHIMLRGL
jgi:hypothetical protein